MKNTIEKSITKRTTTLAMSILYFAVAPFSLAADVNITVGQADVPFDSQSVVLPISLQNTGSGNVAALQFNLEYNPEIVGIGNVSGSAVLNVGNIVHTSPSTGTTTYAPKIEPENWSCTVSAPRDSSEGGDTLQTVTNCTDSGLLNLTNSLHGAAYTRSISGASNVNCEAAPAITDIKWGPGVNQQAATLHYEHSCQICDASNANCTNTIWDHSINVIRNYVSCPVGTLKSASGFYCEGMQTLRDAIKVVIVPTAINSPISNGQILNLPVSIIGPYFEQEDLIVTNQVVSEHTTFSHPTITDDGLVAKPVLPEEINGGTINGIAKINGQHILYGHTLVAQGAELHIAAGSSLHLDYNAQLQVNGKLVIEGTKDSPVIISSSTTTPAKGDWQGIVFNPGSEGVLDSVHIQWASVAIDVRDAQVTLSNSVVENYGEVGLKIVGPNAGGMVTHNVFDNKDNSGVGIYLEDDVVTYVGLNTYPVMINENLVVRNDTGIQVLRKASPVISLNNTITQNKTGIKSLGTGLLGDNSNPIVRVNNIFRNTEFNYYTNDFYNAVSTSLDGKANWWGLLTLSQLPNSIFDQTDTVTAPVVAYTPIQASYTPNDLPWDSDVDGTDDKPEFDTGRNPFLNEPAIISIITSILLD